MKDFSYKPLTEDEMSFLKSYKPADRHFTSAEEIAKVSKALSLITYEHASQLRELRNSVVAFYRFMSATLRIDMYEMMPSIQSVTAIIDNNMYRYSYCH